MRRNWSIFCSAATRRSRRRRSSIEGVMWKRLTVDGKPHPTSFMRGSDELQTTTVSRAQKGEFSIHSGFKNLVVMKTADSGFEGYIKDDLTTLKETSDRLFCTAVTAEWRYTKSVARLRRQQRSLCARRC